MTTNSDHEVFWLARYTHNTLAPLIAEAKTIEPSIRFSIELSFRNPGIPHAAGHVNVYAHWDHPNMFLYDMRHRTKADIDKLADQVRDKIAGLKDTQEISKLLESVSV